MRQHSRKNEEFVWFNVDLMEGSNAEFTPSNNAPHATQSPAGRGRIVRVLNDDDSGTIAFPLTVASQTYRNLRALFKTDKLNENVVGVGLYKNANLGLAVKYKNMSILDFPPPPGAGTEAAVVVVTFGYESEEEAQSPQVPVVGQ